MSQRLGLIGRNQRNEQVDSVDEVFNALVTGDTGLLGPRPAPVRPARKACPDLEPGSLQCARDAGTHGPEPQNSD